MATGLDERQGVTEDLAARIEELTARLDRIEDSPARRTADELVGALIELYGEGLERILRALDRAGAPGEALLRGLAGDGIVASLLLIHGLHPVPLETRVGEALDSIRPYMESHGGGVEVLSLEDGVLRLRLEGSCNGCGASASTLELAIEQALDEAAPDLEAIEVEGVVEPGSGVEFRGGQLPLVDAAPAAWTEVEVNGLAGDALLALEPKGVGLVVANVAGTLLAYRNRCAGCGARLDSGELEGGVLTCASCRRQFALTLAGRVMGDEQLQLTPVPLLEEDGAVRIALG